MNYKYISIDTERLLEREKDFFKTDIERYKRMSSHFTISIQTYKDYFSVGLRIKDFNTMELEVSRFHNYKRKEVPEEEMMKSFERFKKTEYYKVFESHLKSLRLYFLINRDLPFIHLEVHNNEVQIWSSEYFIEKLKK